MLAGKQCNLLHVALDRSTTRQSENGHERAVATAVGAGTTAKTSVALEPSPHRRVIFTIVSVAMLMASIDQTIVATALPALQHDLHTQINWASWTITVYALGRVLVLPLAGRLSDQYGRRTVFL
ncbi:MAG TPA: MFS transporter, partial [Micromonosporaceae bacterium]|nr:MFS transporter [Micromonosporaceae bacterium]